MSFLRRQESTFCDGQSKIIAPAGVFAIKITIDIPDWLLWPFVMILLLYRRLRYGCPFRNIPLTRGKVAIIDQSDFKKINQHKWQAVKWGKSFYAARTYRDKLAKKNISVRMHRQIIDVPTGMVVDHINHDGLDNRKTNLRPATHSQNNCNRRKHRGSSKYRGVSWCKSSKKWRAIIKHKYKKYDLGFFENQQDAARAYDNAARKHHGNFAKLNFPKKKETQVSLP